MIDALKIVATRLEIYRLFYYPINVCIIQKANLDFHSILYENCIALCDCYDFEHSPFNTHLS